MNDKDAIVLLSGGLDSTTCLALAVQKYGKDKVLAVSMYYGQKHVKELECAHKVAMYYGVDHIEHEVTGAFAYSDCSLLQGNRKDIVEGSYADQQRSRNDGQPVETYVPFRNGLFLSHAAAIALSVNASVVMFGAHRDDVTGDAYPDCSIKFWKTMNQAIKIGTGNKVEVSAPFIRCNKAQIVGMGTRLNVPYELTWSCYKGGDVPCGKCGTCIDRAEAFKKNGLEDPLICKN